MRFSGVNSCANDQHRQACFAVNSVYKEFITNFFGSCVGVRLNLQYKIGSSLVTESINDEESFLQYDKWNRYIVSKSVEVVMADQTSQSHRAHSRKICQRYSLGLLTFSGCVEIGLVDPWSYGYDLPTQAIMAKVQTQSIP